jgi:hypothetical protein
MARGPAELASRSPAELARELVEAGAGEWAEQLVSELERRLASRPLERAIRVWDLSVSKTARMFGVSRQGFQKWLDARPPADRLPDVARLDRATQLLVDHVRPTRIPAVVRRPSRRLSGRSLLDLALDGDLDTVVAELEHTFDLARVQP